MLILSEINYAILALVMMFSYFLGSVSFGIITTKFMNLGNLRSLGSGNIGATNVLRTGNKTAAILTLLLDAGKGYVAIYATNYFFDGIYLQFVATAVFLGHVFPIYYRFKGGKGVATFLGIILASNSIVGLMTCIVWLGIALFSKKSSLASLGCSLVAPLFLILESHNNPILYAFILTFLIWWSHRENIKRLILKTEPSISFLKKKT